MCPSWSSCSDDPGEALLLQKIRIAVYKIWATTVSRHISDDDDPWHTSVASPSTPFFFMRFAGTSLQLSSRLPERLNRVFRFNLDRGRRVHRPSSAELDRSSRLLRHESGRTRRPERQRGHPGARVSQPDCYGSCVGLRVCLDRPSRSLRRRQFLGARRDRLRPARSLFAVHLDHLLSTSSVIEPSICSR